MAELVGAFVAVITILISLAIAIIIIGDDACVDGFVTIVFGTVDAIFTGTGCTIAGPAIADVVYRAK